MRAQPQTQHTKPPSSGQVSLLKPVSTIPALRSSPRKHASKAAEAKLVIAQAKAAEKQKTNKASSARRSPQKTSRAGAPSLHEQASSKLRRSFGAVPTQAAPSASCPQDQTVQRHFSQTIDQLGVGEVGIREYTPIPDDPDPLRTAIEEAQFHFGDSRQSSLEIYDEMKMDDPNVYWEARYGPKGRLDAGTHGWDFSER